MKTTFIILALLGLASAAAPSKVCFTKSTKCCFKFAPCGFVTKDVKVSKPCPFKKCELKCAPVCKTVCTPVKKKVPTKVCVPKVVKVCTIVKGKYGKWGKPIKVCKKVVKGKICKIVIKIVIEKKCEKVCKKKCVKVCFRIHAICTQVKTFKFTKFCPKLVCGKPIITGSSKTPAAVVSKKGVVVKISPVTKKIISKKPW